MPTAPSRTSASRPCRARRRRRRRCSSGGDQAWLAPRRVRPGVPLRRRGPRQAKDDVAHGASLLWAQGRDHRRLPRNGWCATATGSSARGFGAAAGGALERLVIRADHVFVCAGAVETPALLQRSGIRRNAGNWLKMHPTVKIAARFPHLIDHGDVAMHRITEFVPSPTIGGSASRRGHIVDGAGRHRAAVRRGVGRLGEHLGLLRRHPQRGQWTGPGGTGAGVAGRHLQAHRGRPEPVARGIVQPRRAAAGGGRHRATPSILEDRWCAAPTSWARGGCPHPEPRQPRDCTSRRRCASEDRQRTGADSFGRGAIATCGSTTRRCSLTPPASTPRRRSWPSPPATATSSCAGARLRCPPGAGAGRRRHRRIGLAGAEPRPYAREP